MSSPAAIAYAGTLLGDQLKTSPWAFVSAMFPDHGSPCDKPQFALDVLQPQNVDGARYRVGGMHFPQFKMVGITVAADFASARNVARQMEQCKGDMVSLATTIGAAAQWRCAVIDVRAVPSGKRIVGATAPQNQGGGGSVQPPGGGALQVAAMASIDSEWTLQVILP